MITDQETRYNIGICYILVSLANISVHLLLLIGDTLLRVKNFLKRKYCPDRLKPKATPSNTRWWSYVPCFKKFNWRMPRGIRFHLRNSGYLYPVPEQEYESTGHSSEEDDFDYGQWI